MANSKVAKIAKNGGQEWPELAENVTKMSKNGENCPKKAPEMASGGQ